MEPTRFGNYLLLEKIGKGGMAEVFLALSRDEGGLSRVVAIKRLHAHLGADPRFLSMFSDEANIASRLRHPGVCQIYDLGCVDDEYFIALEHVHGRDLKAIFARLRQRAEPVPPAIACAIAREMLEALHHAHELRDEHGASMEFVHRDISLQNVLVSFAGEVKLIDFGVAKATGRSTHTQAGLVKGKFAYMSPEQLRGLPVDRRSDLFSAGTVLFEMLTGRRLFLSESTMETVRRVRDAEIVPPRSVVPGIPAELEDIVLRALARHVDDRFQSAAEMADALERFVRQARLVTGPRDLGLWLRALFAGDYAAERARLAALSAAPAPMRLAVGTAPGALVPVSAGPEEHTASVDIDFDESQVVDERLVEPEPLPPPPRLHHPLDAADSMPTMVFDRIAFGALPAVAPPQPPDRTFVGWAPAPRSRRA
jgi:serine/threonine protein kinase